MRFFVKADGTQCTAYNYTPKDKTLIEVPFPPPHGKQRWNGKGYDPLPVDQTTEDKEALNNPEAANRLLVELVEKTGIDTSTLKNKAIYDKLKAATGRSLK